MVQQRQSRRLRDLTATLSRFLVLSELLADGGTQETGSFNQPMKEFKPSASNVDKADTFSLSSRKNHSQAAQAYMKIREAFSKSKLAVETSGFLDKMKQEMTEIWSAFFKTMSSKYERKRKRDLDKDTTTEDSSSRSRSRRHDSEEHDHLPLKGLANMIAPELVMETETRLLKNVRPEVEIERKSRCNEPAPKPLPGEESAEADLPKLAEGEELFTEDGVNIVHKKADNWSSKKESEKLKERLETHKQKRQIQNKVLKVQKGLADSDSEGDEAAAAWVEKSRVLEEQRKKAQQKAKMLDEMDEAFGIGGLIEEERKRISKPAARPKEGGGSALTAGLIVGHSKQVFVDGKDTILILQDKGVLEDNDEEVLINPNLLENERHKRNIELKKKKGNYQPYEDDEAVDEFGQPSKQKMLSKYDEGLDGDEKERETFRLDKTGGYDIDKEAQEEETKRKLLMANRKFESLQSAKLSLAREFYTDEEMISFRRPTKKNPDKVRKRKTLKASDLAPEEDAETVQEKEARVAKLAARRREEGSKNGGGEGHRSSSSGFRAPIAPVDPTKALEEGELEEEHKVKLDEVAPKGKQQWKSGTGASVDVNKLKKFAEQKDQKRSNGDQRSDEEESSDDDIVGGVNLAGVVLDDDAEDELGAALERARKIRQAAAKSSSNGGTGAEQVRAMLLSSGALKREIKQEDDMEQDEDSVEENDNVDGNQIIFDATSEQYKAIGEIPTFGLAGNRRDGVDFSTMDSDLSNLNAAAAKALKQEDVDSDGQVISSKKEKSRKRSKKSKKHSSGTDVKDKSWKDALESSKASSSRHKSSRRKRQSEDEDEEGDYENVLGEEEDVTKGVGAMLKLAGVKGYLEASNNKGAGDGVWKQMLESKRFSKVEQGKYDIEDKTMRKLERLGTTGTGPIRPFADKADYKPAIEINYSDSKGRVMGSKEAFRALSWKFHGKGPGKKQIEKHQAKLEKREKLKMMNSSDTPLQTLDKQRNKQEQLGTPYLILSGTGRDTGTSLQKD
uniref:U4/U6.U5 tri-snRNP-associated protein 1 n=1 Tax=Ditylenchus dipsaci TaxID=166011 RepID=A0A915EEI4_9BILA